MKNILGYLEQTMEKYPDRPAVDDGDICLTWRELVHWAKTLGTIFSGLTDIKKPVVIFAEKKTVTLAAMFGVVYAGCFYVMADPAQPAERLKKILSILDPELIVLEKEWHEKIITLEQEKNVYILESVPAVEVDEGLLGKIREQSGETDLLYTIFTSGSTGVPKGVAVSHKAVMDFIGHFIDTFGFQYTDCIGNQAPFDFDVSVKDIYTCVFTGAELVIIPKKMFSIPAVLLDYLCDKKVTVLIWAVSALTLVSSLKGLKYKVPEHVKKILFSGEVMPMKQLKLWQEALPEARFVNLYGPSEITCNCTYFPLEAFQDAFEKLPIGYPFPGRYVFLQDENGKDIDEPFKTGEICVAGESLADGYYGNPEETKKHFVHNASGEKDRFIYYKTGDLGYYGKQKELYFAGRKDFQIKHMGHRIELEEIENVINNIDGVEKSCCLLDMKKNQLVGFYLGDISPDCARKKLKDRLPVYMVPHRLLRMECMPINKNGKTDRSYFRRLLENE